jgi:hypothetical protein
LYVCVEVDGNKWLLADLTTSCDTDTWRQAAYGDLILVLLYPIMIPMFFCGMLFRYRKRLDQSGVRAELGFLYDGYERSFYLFELVDMVHKLCITSLIAFIPSDWQLRAAMILVTLYLIVILFGKPYIRKGDDILHCFVQVEVLLLLMAGYVFTTLSGPDSLMDGLLSVVLIVAVLALFLYFLLSAANVFWKWLKHTECGQRFACIRGSDADQQFSVGKTPAPTSPTAGAADSGAQTPIVKKKMKAKKVDNSIAGEMKRVYRIDRHTMRQHGRVATARGASDDDAVAMVRNAAWGDAELAKATQFQTAAPGLAAGTVPLVNDGSVASPRASTTTGATGLVSPRRALLAMRLGEDLPASANRGVELTTLARSSVAQSAAVPTEQLSYATPAPTAITDPQPAAVEAPRSSTADLLAQPLGTTPAGAPAAIELQAVTTAPVQPILMSEVQPLPARKYGVASLPFTCVLTLPCACFLCLC